MVSRVTTNLHICRWWLPETVFWLHANNKIEEAEMVLLRAAKMNSVILVRPIFKPLEDGLEEIEIEKTQKFDVGATRKDEEKTALFGKTERPVESKLFVNFEFFL